MIQSKVHGVDNMSFFSNINPKIPHNSHLYAYLWTYKSTDIMLYTRDIIVLDIKCMLTM